MAMTAEQPRRKSVTDYANSAVNTAQTARTVVQTAKKIQVAISAISTLVSTWEIWVPALIIIIVVVLFIVIITTIIGQDNTNGNSGSSGVGQPVQGQTLTCPSGDYAACLRDDFNVVVSGALPSYGLQRIFDIMANAASSPTWKDFITCGGGTIPIVVTNNGGASTSYGTITLNSFFVGGKTIGSQSELLIHELGHTIAHQDCSRIFEKYPYSTLVAEDPICYDNGYLRTYSLRCGSACGINPRGESFAESIGIYVTYKSFTNPTGYLSSITLKGIYKTLCPHTYDWIKTNIFGGVEF